MKRIFIDTNVLVDLEVNDVSVVSPKQFLAAF